MWDKEKCVDCNSGQNLSSWASCTKCVLHVHRKNVVFATGNKKDPKIFIIGQAPGETEDEKGVPFVGKVSWHLNAVLEKVGISRERDCCLTNSVICRPWIPGVRSNYAPQVSSILACRPRLIAEFNKVAESVKVVVLVGKEALMTWRMHEAMAKPDSFDPAKVRISSHLGWKEMASSTTAEYCVYHPSYIARRGDPMLARQWMDDWSAVAQYALHDSYTNPRSH